MLTFSKKQALCAATSILAMALSPSLLLAQTSRLSDLPVVDPGNEQKKPVKRSVGGVSVAPDKRATETLARSIEETIVDRNKVNSRVKTAHVIVFLREPPSRELADELAKQEIKLLSKIDNWTWVAEVSVVGAEKLQQNNAIEAAMLYPTEAKKREDVAKRAFPDHVKSGDQVALSVAFHQDTPPEEARMVISQLGGKVIEFDAKAFLITKVARFAINQNAIESLASFDAVRWIEADQPPIEDHNQANTQPLSNVNAVQAAPYNLTGAGVTVGVFEANDVVRATHQDLSPRVTVQAGQTASEDGHALHVAGTIGASGVNSAAAEGMAPSVNMLSWDTVNDVTELTNATTPNLTIIAENHSNGPGLGWNGTTFNSNQNQFGTYTTRSQSFDNIIATTGVVSIKSAGNDRDDNGGGAASPAQPADCTQNAFPGGTLGDCIDPQGGAKNNITVGAMSGAGAIAGYSSFGPTDDGRIKPDIVANGGAGGNLVTSLGRATNPQDNISTYGNAGTSMAAPAVTGIVALMFEEAANLNIALDADSVKALLIQTARDVAGIGQAQVGPDYATGWGIADAQAAIDLMRLPGGPGLAQDTMTTTGVGGAYTLPFFVPAGQPEMHVTLAWSDPVNTAGAATSVLTNDLDLRLIAPDGTTVFRPWTLNGANPGLAAVRNGGDDIVNTVEQVSVLTPVAGVWYAQVTAKAGSLVAGGQNFSLAGPFRPATGPVPSTKANIMLVLDKSGSMNLPSASPGLSKLGAMQQAATAFVDYIEVVGGHNLGMVQFAGTVVPFAGGAFDMQSLDSGSVGTARSRIAGMAGGGLTNIIDGVTNANSQLAGAAASNPVDTVFLFTDGRHNRPTGSDVSTIDTLMASDTNFYGIGFGTDVDSSVMPGVAANHNGLWLEEQTLSAAALAKLFLLVGGLTVNETIVVDPDYRIAPRRNIAQSANAISMDRSMTFVTTWENQDSRPSFFLTGPNRECKIADQDHPGYKTRSGLNYKIIRVEFPYSCENDSLGAMHAGQWQLRVGNSGRNTISSKVMVLSNSQLEMIVNPKIEGNLATIEARLTIDGKPLNILDGKVAAFISKRNPSTKDSEKLDSKGSEVKPAERLSSSNIRIGKNLRALRRDSNVVSLNDSGKFGDRVAGDGIYTIRLPFAEGSGLQQMRIVLEGKADGNNIRREAMTSFVIK